MPAHSRSPFGELLYQHRRRSSLSQRELVERTYRLASADATATAVSERTVISLERAAADPARWRFPRIATARVLALAPGTPPWDAFIAAAHRDGHHGNESEPAASGGPNEFVAAGRERHLQRLRSAIDATVGGRTGALFVSADPGTGKTWLLEEATRQALARHPDLVVLWTQCSGRIGAADPHQPFRQMLGLMMGDLATATPRQRGPIRNTGNIQQRLPLAVEGLLTEGSDLIHRFISPDRLCNDTLLGAIDDETRRTLDAAIQRGPAAGAVATDTNEQFLRVIRRYAEAGPVILVLEDLHWVDVGTSTVLFHMLNRLYQQEVPILVIGSFRPGDLGPPVPGERHPFPPVLHEIPLLYPDPILDLSSSVGGNAGRDFVVAMTRQSKAPLTDEAIDDLFERTRGLPLFVTGILRLRQLDETDASKNELAPCADRTPLARLPSEIEMLFSEQLDRLTPELRRFLEAASVQGNGFLAEVVGRMFDISSFQLIDMLDTQLARRHRQVITGGVSTISGIPVNEYQFTHALFRDYMYNSLSNLERKHLHETTANAMIGLFGAEGHEATATIAWHLDQSGNPVAAARAWLRAGNRSLLVSEFDRAVRYYERAGEIDARRQDPYTWVQARVGLGNCARALGDVPEARSLLTRAHELARQERLPAVQANALASLGMVDFDAGRVHEGANRLRKAIELHLEAGDLAEACRSMARLSHNLHGMGRYDEAAAMARRGMALATDLDDDMMFVGAKIALTNCWIDTGYYEDAIAAYDECIALSRIHHDTHRENICLFNIALCAFELGQWDRSEAAIQRLLEPGRTVVERFMATAEFDLGVIAEGRGDPATARDHYARSLEIRQQTEQHALLIDSLAGLLRVAVTTGDRDEIRRLVDELSHRIEERGLDGVEHVGRLYVSLIDAAQALGDERLAEEYAGTALAFLTDRAQLLADPARRQSYLTNPPAHRRIMQLANVRG